MGYDVPEARTALTSASAGDALPPSCACWREWGDDGEKGLAETLKAKHVRVWCRRPRDERLGRAVMPSNTRRDGRE